MVFVVKRLIWKHLYSKGLFYQQGGMYGRIVLVNMKSTILVQPSILILLFGLLWTFTSGDDVAEGDIQPTPTRK